MTPPETPDTDDGLPTYASLGLVGPNPIPPRLTPVPSYSPISRANRWYRRTLGLVGCIWVRYLSIMAIRLLLFPISYLHLYPSHPFILTLTFTFLIYDSYRATRVLLRLLTLTRQPFFYILLIQWMVDNTEPRVLKTRHGTIREVN